MADMSMQTSVTPEYDFKRMRDAPKDVGLIDVERALHDAQNMLHYIMGTHFKYVPKNKYPFGFSREKYLALNDRITAALFFLWRKKT